MALNRLRHSEAQQDSETARLAERVAADIAILGIKSLILVSGGAILAIMTFIGNLWAREHDDALAKAIAAHMTVALAFYAAALCVAIITAVVAYVSSLGQALRHNAPGTWMARNARTIRLVGICLALVSAGLFTVGTVFAMIGLRGV
jgi:hypothetical protein